MLIAGLAFLVQSLFGLVVLVFLLRFLLQVCRAPWQHPLSQFLIRFTNPVLRPLRLRSTSGVDFGALVVAFFLTWAEFLILGFLSGPALPSGNILLGTILLAFLGLLRWAVYIFMGAVFIEALMSFINPYNLLTPVLASLTRPVLTPFRRFIKPIAGMDFSPLVALIVGQFLLFFPIGWLQVRVAGMMYASYGLVAF